MTRLSLIDKLGVLIDVSKSSSILLIILLVLVAAGIGLTFINPKNEKRYKAIYVIIVSIITLLLVISNFSTLGKMFNFMMDNFFVAALFPNIAIYVAAIIAMNIIVWVSVFNYRSARLIRNLNIFVYMIMNYLLALILHVIMTNKLDVYSQESIYKNDNARALIELSSTIFIIWVIFLVLYKIILTYLRKDYKPKVKKIIVHKKVKVLPQNFQPMGVPKKVYGNAPHNEKIIIKEEKEEVKEKEKFTLEEYKLFYEILKNQQKKKDKVPAKKNKVIVDNKKYKATDNEIKDELYVTPLEEENSIKQINKVDDLIDNLLYEQADHYKAPVQEAKEELPEIIIDDEPTIEKDLPVEEPVVEEVQDVQEEVDEDIEQINKVDDLIDNLLYEQAEHYKAPIEEEKEEVIEDEPAEVQEESFEEINKDDLIVIEEPVEEEIEEKNNTSQIVRAAGQIDEEEKSSHEVQYDTEPLPELTDMESYRKTQKQEIIKMEEERRELLRQEQLRIEQEQQEKLAEQQRQEEIRKQHLKEMAEKERQERLKEEQRQQELEIERQRQLQLQEEQRQREMEEQEELANRLLQQKLEEEAREQEKLTELERLYRSIR